MTHHALCIDLSYMPQVEKGIADRFKTLDELVKIFPDTLPKK